MISVKIFTKIIICIDPFLSLIKSIFSATSWTKPFSQPRDAAWHKEERADPCWKKLRLWELWKGFASSTKINFMRLLNDLDWKRSRQGVPWRLALKPRESNVFGLSNTKHLRRNSRPALGPAVVRWGADVANLPLQDTSRPDSVVWPLTHVALGQMAFLGLLGGGVVRKKELEWIWIRGHVYVHCLKPY